jgi:enoyl-CoA hydratase/carnithine racemase
MSDAGITTTIEDGVAVVRFDDGKANALGYAALDALKGALAQAQEDATAVLIVGRPGVFSAGFDLKVMTKGVDDALKLAAAGWSALVKVFLHPQPVVAAVTGHALAAGAVLISTCDVRIGADIPAKIGLNETAIGLALPPFAIELARERLDPRELQRATLGAHIYDPAGAVQAGYLDRVVSADEVEATAFAEAQRLGALSAGAYGTTKKLLRQPVVDRVEAASGADLGNFVADVS